VSKNDAGAINKCYKGIGINKKTQRVWGKDCRKI
jgi:hypothetical protein